MTATTYYHGTTSKALPTIAQMGLVPGKFPGADIIGRIFDGMDLNYERGPSVYLTVDPSIAAWYASYAVRARAGQPMVLKVRVPHDKAKDLIVDEAESDGLARRCECVIKPEWIESFIIVGEDWQKFNWQKFNPKELSNEAPQ